MRNEFPCWIYRDLVTTGAGKLKISPCRAPGLQILRSLKKYHMPANHNTQRTTRSKRTWLLIKYDIPKKKRMILKSKLSRTYKLPHSR